MALLEGAAQNTEHQVGALGSNPPSAQLCKAILEAIPMPELNFSTYMTEMMRPVWQL